MLNNPRSYEEACRTFRWRIPDRYNLAFDVCDRQTMAGADGHRTALIVESADGQVERYTFHVLRLLSNRLANVLSAYGVTPGDLVALALPAGIEAAVAILAVARMGAVSVPIPVEMGAEPLAWRLEDSAAKVAVFDAAIIPALAEIRHQLPRLETVLVPNHAGPGCVEMWAALEESSDSFAPLVTPSSHPAFVFYPAHGCGKPPGAVLPHRAMAGGLPAVEMSLGLFPQFGDVVWTSADWMTGEALFRAVLPAWHHGVPMVASSGVASSGVASSGVASSGVASSGVASSGVASSGVARAGGFEPVAALEMMARHGVRAAYLPGHHLAELTEAASRRPHSMPRALASGPEPLSADLHERVIKAFGIHANEAWGTLETGAVAANLAGLMELRPPSPGRAAPGLTLEAVDERGRALKAGERGILAVSPNAPGNFLGYWGDRGDGPARRGNGWLLTGRLGARDLDNYIWPEAWAVEEGVAVVDGQRVRLDDVEATLAAHPAVAAAGVVELPVGELRAFVVAKPGRGGADLLGELQAWIGLRRGWREVPRRLEFMDALPLAVDGTVLRAELLAQPLRLDAPSSADRWRPQRK